MKPKFIKTDAQYQATLARIEQIFDAKPDTAKGDELELLLLLVEKYEEGEYPISLPDPIAALRFRMEQGGLTPKDLAPYIGSKSKVSEVLSGRRPLSLTMIRKLVDGRILPAEVALRPNAFVTRVRECIAEARRREKSRAAIPYLPDIIASLEHMLLHLNDNGPMRSKRAGGLGRLVTEDWAFADSPFGLKLIKIANDFAAFSSTELCNGDDS